MHRVPWQVQVIDDEVVILMAVSRAYRDKPIDIVTATNVDQALGQMDVFNFDLFLLDLDMKGSCSFKLLEVMTERFPEIPVILMTTRDIGSQKLLEKIAAVRLTYCWHLLEKPFGYGKLTGFIDRALQARSIAASENHQCAAADGHEKRRCKRFSRFEQINMSFPLTCAASSQTVPFLVTLMDISVGGLGLASRKQLTVPQMVSFDEKFMHQSGIIVWSRVQDDQSCRAGIQFT